MPEDTIKAKYIAMLEEAYADKLREVESMPQDIYKKYTLWLRGKIKQATQLQQSVAQPKVEEDKGQKSA